MKNRKITNWGNYPVTLAVVEQLQFYDDIKHFVADNSNIIARGNGRCYGDAALAKVIFSTLKMNKALEFDEQRGIFECQAGMLLSEILCLILPKGFFLPVTPGTKFITAGGAVAADIHGKNHHKEGCFSEHLISFVLMNADGEIITCSRESNTALFWQTCGGMGLTGIILSARFYLKKIDTAYIRQKSIKAANLEEMLELFDKHYDKTYSVAWMDCLARNKELGRGILLLGEHAEPGELSARQKKEPLNIKAKSKINLPFFLPDFVLNTWSIRMFNFLLYNKQWSKELDSVIDYDTYFYPLDSILNWNRLYGKNGFTQYQFVLPKNGGKSGLKEIITEIGNSRTGSFLTVLKLFGPANPLAVMSFPIEGYTLALDFKITPQVFRLLDKLDKIVLASGGRIYLAKDARMKRATFHAGYEHLVKSNKFKSLQAERLEF